MPGRWPQWQDGRRNGIKWAVEWMHRRAKELNDPSAQAAMNVAANDMGLEAKRSFGDEPTPEDRPFLRNQEIANLDPDAARAGQEAMGFKLVRSDR